MRLIFAPFQSRPPLSGAAGSPSPTSSLRRCAEHDYAKRASPDSAPEPASIASTFHNAALSRMQRIFSSATRREALGKHFKGGRRSGELKIDWTKPPPRAPPMCIDCGLDLWRGSEGVGSGQRARLAGQLDRPVSA